MLLNPYRFGGPPSALLTGLVSYWPLNEASGNALDSHGTNHLTDVNTVGTAAGKIGTARSFVSASNESFSLVSPDLTTGNIDFTFSVWMRPTASGNWVVLSKYPNGGAATEFLMYFDSGSRLNWFVQGPGGSRIIDNGGPLTLGIWCHVIAWHDSVNDLIGIAINGGTPATGGLSGGATSSPSLAFRIGACEGGIANWNGEIDEVGFWKRMLTPAERTELYNAGAGKAYPFT